MEWKFYPAFKDIPAGRLYEVLKLRQDVFIIEQNCIYEDIDQLDQESRHLLLLDSENDTLCGYLRIVPPGKKFTEISIGRIVIEKIYRGQGLGKALIKKAVKILEEEKSPAIRIEAQAHLRQFYTQLGFIADSPPYDLDGIPHLEMVYEIIRPSGDNC